MRPTGALHLGNYHGALRNWVELQYQYECFFFVADWHALTTGYEDTAGIPARDPRGPDRLAGCRAEPGRRHAVRAVACARARRTAPAAVDDHPARLARARADLQGSAGAAQGQGPGDLRFPRLSAAAERRHPAVPRRLRAGRRGPGGARGDSRARSRAASIISTAASRISSRRPSARSRNSAGATSRSIASCGGASRRPAIRRRSSARARWWAATPASRSPTASGCSAISRAPRSASCPSRRRC